MKHTITKRIVFHSEENTNKYILDVMKERLIKQRKEKRRVKSIFKRFKKLKEYEYWSDTILLNAIVYGLVELGLPYSEDEITSAFKIISSDDFNEEQRKGIKKHLLRSSIKRSPFN